ncbi:MAG: hypothetical protein HYS62_01860 [Candidatus Aenigmarchaeota archaeon]|nr:hypothetical protein [Candidatus Aenigmarchaeota archaeon]
MDVNNSRITRPPILRRKVMIDGRKRQGGIYDVNGNPADHIIPGKIYMAKINGGYVRVRAQPNQTMQIAGGEELRSEIDPRTSATEAYARSVGFNLTTGAYENPA